MADREKLRKLEMQKFEYLENEKSFLDEIRRIFHNYFHFKSSFCSQDF